MSIQINAFFHESTFTLSYLIYDTVSLEAAIVDPVRDFDLVSGKTHWAFCHQQNAAIEQLELKLIWVLETHAHADHLSGAQYWRQHHSAKLGVGEGIVKVQRHFRQVFNSPDVSDSGREFDHLFAQDATFQLGAHTGRVINTPGHTNDSVSFYIGGALFVGDTLFMPDVGSARCDFPGGDAGVLYDSVQTLYAFSDDTPMYVCHDYPPANREMAYQTSVGAQKRDNIHLNQSVTREEFIRLRQKRDAQLGVPRLLYPGLQVNIRAGKLPPPESNQQRYLKLPLSV